MCVLWMVYNLWGVRQWVTFCRILIFWPTFITTIFTRLIYLSFWSVMNHRMLLEGCLAMLMPLNVKFGLLDSLLLEIVFAWHIWGTTYLLQQPISECSQDVITSCGLLCLLRSYKWNWTWHIHLQMSHFRHYDLRKITYEGGCAQNTTLKCTCNHIRWLVYLQHPHFLHAMNIYFTWVSTTAIALDNHPHLTLRIELFGPYLDHGCDDDWNIPVRGRHQWAEDLRSVPW